MIWTILICAVLAGLGVFIYKKVKKSKEVEPPRPFPPGRRRAVQAFQLWGNAGQEQNIYKHGLFMHIPEYFGLLRLGRNDATSPTMIHQFEPASIEIARERITELRRLNPNIIILADCSYTEGRDNYTDIPPNHVFWKRVNGQRVQGWIGWICWLFDLDQPAYRQNCAATAKSCMDLGLFDGIFFDCLEDTPQNVDILRRFRALCPNALILGNVNYRICPNLAPLVNGFLMECNSAAPWDQLRAACDFNARNVKQPSINCLEINGQRGDDRKMRASTCLAVCYDCFTCYADAGPNYASTHQHEWQSYWELDLGLPVEPPLVLTNGNVKRQFEHGEANFIPTGDSYIYIR